MDATTCKGVSLKYSFSPEGNKHLIHHFILHCKLIRNCSIQTHKLESYLLRINPSSHKSIRSFSILAPLWFKSPDGIKECSSCSSICMHRCLYKISVTIRPQTPSLQFSAITGQVRSYACTCPYQTTSTYWVRY